jgi:hypothetical protein
MRNTVDKNSPASVLTAKMAKENLDAEYSALYVRKKIGAITIFSIQRAPLYMASLYPALIGGAVFGWVGATIVLLLSLFGIYLLAKAVLPKSLKETAVPRFSKVTFYKSIATTMLKEMKLYEGEDNWIHGMETGDSLGFGRIGPAIKESAVSSEKLYLFTYPQNTTQMRYLPSDGDTIAAEWMADKYHPGFVTLSEKYDLYMKLAAEYPDTIQPGFGGMVLLSKDAGEAKVIAENSITVGDFTKFKILGISSENFVDAKSLPDSYLQHLKNHVDLTISEKFSNGNTTIENVLEAMQDVLKSYS